MERNNRSQSFIDALTQQLGGPRTGDLLSRLDQAVPWDKLAAPIRRLPEYQPNPRGGRPAWPAVMMLKCIMLAKWFNLSDPQLEECLQDRLSFRRFVGLSLEDATPDETTFVVFRRRLREARLDRKLFDLMVQHLDAQGLLVHEGTLVDASIVEQSRGRTKADGSSTRDPEASYTRKHDRSYHGYKTHIAVDRSTLVTDYQFTTAKEHDSKRIDELIAHERTAVFADSAYADAGRRQRLRERGVLDGIVYKRKRNQSELPDWQRHWNALLSKVRAVVEHPLATVKHQFGWRRCRYRGLRRNAVDCAFLLIAANAKRSLSVRSSRGSPAL